MNKPKILLISTGGTISSRFEDGKGYSPALTGMDVLGGAAEFFEVADIEVIQPFNILSFELMPQQVLDVVNMAKAKVADGEVAGVVVTQGTATIEESAYLADLLWDREEPIVFTGSMLNSSERDWDGPRNVRAAILIAVSSEARGKGVVVCLGGEIHAARDVVKVHKTQLTPLVSVNTGPLGLVNYNNQVVFYRSPLQRKVFSVEALETSVDIIKVALGSDSRLLEASIGSGARAIVLEAFPGGGGVTPQIMRIVQKFSAEGFYFVMAPRSLGGRIESNAGGGSGPYDLRRCGVISAGDLSAIKARVLLMVVLPIINDRTQLANIFREVAP